MFNHDQLMLDNNPKKRKDLPIFHNLDDVKQAEPKLKKIKQKPHDLVLEEQIEIQTTAIKLTIELVPKTCWFDNVRSNISIYYWNKLSKACRENANSQCEICNRNVKKLDCHEIWHYDEKSKIQKLKGLIALCKLCHDTKHMGLAMKQGRREIVKNHLMFVNRWDVAETEKYVEQVFIDWQRRSLEQWTLDISWLETQGIPLKKLKKLNKDIPQIIKACTEKNIEEIKLLIAEMSEAELKKAIYNSENKKKLNPIHNAVLDGDINFLEDLLKISKFLKYINEGDKYRETPAFYAVINKKFSMLKLLVLYGADITIVNSHRRTLLHCALNNKDVETVNFLFENGAEKLCHQYDDWDKLPLHLLCNINEEELDTDKIQELCDLIG